MAATTAAKLSTFDAQLLERVLKALKPLNGLKFELQGEISSGRDGNSVKFCIAPLEWITLECLGDGDWKVSFVVNDPGDAHSNWEQVGPYGHVIHGFRGYVVHKCLGVAPLKSLLAAISLD